MGRNIPFEVCTATAGGTLTGILAAIEPGELAKTVILSVTGTIVSFVLSVILKRLFAKRVGSDL